MLNVHKKLAIAYEINYIKRDEMANKLWFFRDNQSNYNVTE